MRLCVEAEALGEDQLLETPLLFRVCRFPKLVSPCHDSPREAERGLHVEVLDGRVPEFQRRKGQGLFEAGQFVVIGGPVDRLIVDVGLDQPLLGAPRTSEAETP